MTEPPSDQRDQFGTPAFYASLGKAFVVMCAVIPVLFAIELIDKATGHALDRDGAIVPHHISGLDGIVFAPFLHVSFVHLYSNAIPLLLTGTFVLAAGGKRFLWITLLITLISGIGVWIFGDGPTIGASGVIFGYLGYLFLRGLIERNWWNIAVALLVGLLFGTAITGVLPGDEQISWQGHLFGFIGGLIAAVVFRKQKPKPAPITELPSTLTIPPVAS